jgi:hypothetical protein
MADFGWSYPAGCSGTPYDDKEPETVERIPGWIATLEDLCAHFDADEPMELNKRLHKDTDCGASISIQTLNGAWHHNGQDWTGISAIHAFTIQTMIEGSDVTVDSDVFVLPVPTDDVDKWMEYMEEESVRLWVEANMDDEGFDDYSTMM